MPESKQDRELIELLNELRVALPGVQVLFAFLLTIPFTQRFPQVTSTQKGAYFIAFLGVTAASIFLIAPTAFHRLQWRQHDKERLLQDSNRFAIIGTGFLAIAMTSVVFLISDFLFSGGVSIPLTCGAAIAFAVLWYVLPLRGRTGEGSRSK